MTTDSIETYYKILGVPSDATVQDIKRAYRLKAMKLHPDNNKSPDAHDEFVLLTEAYDFLISQKQTTTGRKPATEYYNWQSDHRERSRQKAREFAKMEYEKFKQTDFYVASEAAYTVVQHLYFFGAIAVMLSPLWGYLYKGWSGFGVGLLLTFLSVHFWSGIFTEKSTLNARTFLRSLVIVVKSKSFMNVMIVIANLFFFCRVTLNTQLTLFEFAFVFVISYSLVFLAYRFGLKTILKLSKVSLFVHWLPGLLNMFFLINFVFSSNPVTEVYSFSHEMRWYGGRFSKWRLEKIAYINLENDKYKKYVLLRTFFDFETMKNKREIAYQFEDGLLGMRVLKDYEFTK
ncbi:MAG: hypothetical protein RL226_896 [Bacteroidota bacterium]|jgi:hypothetical protein